VAKLRLLDHGMLDAASALDNLHMRPKTKDQDAEKDSETLEAFEKQVQVFVQLNLLRASGSRDNYKHSLVYQARRDLIQQILKASLLKRCQNPGCLAYVASLSVSFLSKESCVAVTGTLSERKVTQK
jgi:hypothetical protein